MSLNKIFSIVLLVISLILIASVFKNKSRGREDLLVEKIRTLGAAILILILAYSLYVTKRNFCELFPYLCN